MTTVAFAVYGHPEPAGSKRAFKHPHTGAIVVTDANKKSKPWKQEVAETAQATFDQQHGPTGLSEYVELLSGPMKVEFTFYLSRPKSHYGTGRNAGMLKESAPWYPVVKPDVDKLSRAVMDALTGVLWRDDAQVVSKVARKRYCAGTPERVAITVERIDRDPQVEPQLGELAA